MNYLSLYRKYRPHNFNDVVGQEHIIQILKNSIKNNAVANAYVFAGVKGTGKTSIAKIYANAINCLNSNNGDICGQCEVCKDFANNQAIDVIELDAASNNGVEEIRQINDAVYALPAKLNKKVYIIDEAHMLTNQAWNALLKTVEEPPKHVVFIFATTEIHKIPSTILSRCQCFTFNKITRNDIVKLLIKVSKAENIKYELEALNTIADIVDGSARDSLSILEQVATYSNNDIKVQDIYDVYGLLSAKDVIDFLNLFVSNKPDKLIDISKKYLSSGINFTNFCNLVVSVLIDKLMYIKTKNYKLLNKTNEVLINSLAINDINKIMRLLDIWQEAYFKVSIPTDVIVVIDHAIIKSNALFDDNLVQVPLNRPIPPVKEPESEPSMNIEIKDVKIEKPVEPKDIFICKEVQWIDDKKLKDNQDDKPKEEKPIPEPQKLVIESIKMPSKKEILLSIVSNKSNDELAIAKDFFASLKSGEITEKEFSCCSLAVKPLFASKDGIIFLFEDEIDAQYLNKHSNNKDFILACCRWFKNPKFIVGFTPKQINEFKNEIKEAMHNNLAPLNIEALRDVLNKDNSIAQKAYNLIFSKIIKEDK